MTDAIKVAESTVKYIGFESANSFVKVFCNGKSVTYANTASKAPKETFNKVDKKDRNSTDVVYEIGEERLNVGKTKNYVSSGGGSIERYNGTPYLLESLIAIAQFAKNGDNLAVCTGIPSDHYRDKDKATEYITNALKKEHTVIVDGEERTFNIIRVHVTLQPLATFFYTVIDEFGESNAEMIARYEDTETLVIDIGWGTTDLAHLLGSSLMSDPIKIDTAMKAAYEEILERLREKAPKGDPIKTGSVKLLDMEKQLRKSDIFKFSNNEYPVGDLKKVVFKKVAENILAEINNYRNLTQFTTVIFTGGGTTALLNIFTEKLADKDGKFPENVFLMADAQDANAKGYYVNAKYLQ
ncbi:ParM/StbA family protein [Bacillus thuringiensis]|uniref:ParM/StbA family protein n=1 Tax=Bacillus thuringiensis TaxID=1428 RepID=UPI0034582CB5